MNPHDIKAALAKKGYTQVAIAGPLNVSQVAVGHVIFGRRKSPRIEQAIIEATGIPGHRLWPGRYSRKTGERIA